MAIARRRAGVRAPWPRPCVSGRPSVSPRHHSRARVAAGSEPSSVWPRHVSSAVSGSSAQTRAVRRPNQPPPSPRMASTDIVSLPVPRSVGPPADLRFLNLTHSLSLPLSLSLWLPARLPEQAMQKATNVTYPRRLVTRHGRSHVMGNHGRFQGCTVWFTGESRVGGKPVAPPPCSSRLLLPEPGRLAAGCWPGPGARVRIRGRPAALFPGGSSSPLSSAVLPRSRLVASGSLTGRTCRRASSLIGLRQRHGLD